MAHAGNTSSRRKERRFSDHLIERPGKVARACWGKKKYPSKKLAKAAVEKAWRREGEILHPYKCQFGNHWHIGHASGTQEIQREDGNGEVNQ